MQPRLAPASCPPRLLRCKGTVEWLQWRPDSRLSLKYYPYSLALAKPRSNKFQFLNSPGTDSAQTPFLFSSPSGPSPFLPQPLQAPETTPAPHRNVLIFLSCGGGGGVPFYFFSHIPQGSQSTFLNTIRNSTTSF